MSMSCQLSTQGLLTHQALAAWWRPPLSRKCASKRVRARSWAGEKEQSQITL